VKILFGRAFFSKTTVFTVFYKKKAIGVFMLAFMEFFFTFRAVNEHGGKVNKFLFISFAP